MVFCRYRYAWWIIFFSFFLWVTLVVLVWGNHLAHYKVLAHTRATVLLLL
jgi:hypothetical protein